MRNRKNFLVWISVILIILAINANLDDSLMTMRIEKNLTNINYENPLKEIMLKLLTGFRDIFARIIWEKIHRYFHRYEFFERAGVLVFNIEDPEKSTYRQTNIVPWIRIATWLDPDFYQPYLVGAWHLANNLGKPEEAEKLLKEVEENNPKDPYLKYQLATNYFMMHQYKKALSYGKIAEKSGELGLFEQLDNYRTIKLSYRKLGNKEQFIEYEKKIRDFVQKHQQELKKIIEENQ